MTKNLPKDSGGHVDCHCLLMLDPQRYIVLWINLTLSFLRSSWCFMVKKHMVAELECWINRQPICSLDKPKAQALSSRGFTSSRWIKEIQILVFTSLCLCILVRKWLLWHLLEAFRQDLCTNGPRCYTVSFAIVRTDDCDGTQFRKLQNLDSS